MSAYIKNLNKQELLEDSKKYKKVKYETLAKEDFKRKEYFNQMNLEQIRDRFRLTASMYGEFKGSFPSRYRRQGKSLKCEMCKYVLDSNTSLDSTCNENMESQTHYFEF